MNFYNINNKITCKVIKISSENPKKPRLRGFAAFIDNLCNAAKDKQECIDFIKGVKTRVLINNKDDKWAALISVNNNQITVEGIEKDSGKDSKKNLRRKDLLWWGYWEIPNLQTLIAAKDWSPGKWIRKNVLGKSVVGPSQIEIVGKILSLGAPTPKNEG